MAVFFVLFAVFFVNDVYGSLYDLDPHAPRDAFGYQPDSDTRYYKSVNISFEQLDSVAVEQGGLVFVFKKFMNTYGADDLYPVEYRPSCWSTRLYDGLAIYLKKDSNNQLVMNQNSYDLAATMMSQAVLSKNQSNSFYIYSQVNCHSGGLYNFFVNKITVDVGN